MSWIPRILGRIERICDDSYGSKQSILALFHSSVSRDRRSETIRSTSWASTGPTGFMLLTGSIQLSDQTLIESPFPTALPKCLIRRSLPRRMPLHPCDMEEEGLVLRKETLWQYFPNRTRAKRQSGLVMILHEIFAKRA